MVAIPAVTDPVTPGGRPEKIALSPPAKAKVMGVIGVFTITVWLFVPAPDVRLQVLGSSRPPSVKTQFEGGPDNVVRAVEPATVYFEFPPLKLLDRIGSGDWEAQPISVAL